MKQCIIDGCADACEKGRRYCRRHYLERKREQSRDRYQKNGRYTYRINCSVCGETIDAWYKQQKYCMDCYRALQKGTLAGKNNYENAKGDGYCWMHRRVAEKLLGRKLNTNEVVHHMDGDPKNNSVDNLIVIGRGKHVSLHSYLKTQGALLLKGNIENFENCWKSLIVPMTTTWLETANVKVIKLWEIGQSAAEPLSTRVYEEGSETMHEAAKCDAQADDIVQTTTTLVGTGNCE